MDATRSAAPRPAATPAAGAAARRAKAPIRATPTTTGPSVADGPPRHAIAEGCPPGLNKYSARITQPKAQGASQAMLYATGLTEADMGKPQVGISSVWYEGNPCNMHLGDLAAEVKAGVEAAGMVGYRFNTIGVSDGISMGTDGMSFSLQSRDLIADSIETVMGAQWYDANVSLPGCDKNMPGTIMAAARLNRPSLMVYGGTIRAGRSAGGEPLDIVSAFQSYGEFLMGRERGRGVGMGGGGGGWEVEKPPPSLPPPSLPFWRRIVKQPVLQSPARAVRCGRGEGAFLRPYQAEEGEGGPRGRCGFGAAHPTGCCLRSRAALRTPYTPARSLLRRGASAPGLLVPVPLLSCHRLPRGA